MDIIGKFETLPHAFFAGPLIVYLVFRKLWGEGSLLTLIFGFYLFSIFGLGIVTVGIAEWKLGWRINDSENEWGVVLMLAYLNPFIYGCLHSIARAVRAAI